MVIMADRVSTATLNILLYAVLSRVVEDKSEYGVFRAVLLVATILTTLSDLSIPESSYYFLPPASVVERRRRLSLILSLAVLSGLVFSLGALLLAGPISGLPREPVPRDYVRLVAFLPLVSLARVTLTNSLIATDRAYVSAGVSIAGTVLRFVVVALVFTLGRNISEALTAYVGVELLAAIALLAIQYRLGGVGLVKPDFAFYRQVLGYSLPLALAYAVGMLSRWLDRLLIGMFFEAAEFGEYVNGAQELPFVAIITQSIAVAIMPNLVSLFQKGQVRQMCSLFAEGIRRSSLLLLPIFAWALVCSHDMILVLYGPKFERSWQPFVVYLFVLPMRVAIFGSVLRAMGNTKPIVWGSLLMLIGNVALGVTLIKLGGGGVLSFVGPAVANVLSLYILSTYMTWLIRRTVRSHGYSGPVLPVKEYLKILGASLAAGAFGLAMSVLLRYVPVQRLAMDWFGLNVPDIVPPALRIMLCGMVIAAGFFVVGRVAGVIQRQDMDLLKATVRRVMVRKGPA